MKTLKEICSIHAPSGEESEMTNYLIKYIDKHKKDWKTHPKIYAGDGFQDNIILV